MFDITKATPEETAEAYVRHYTDFTEDDAWAWEIVGHMARKQPDKGWSTTLAIIQRAPDERFLHHLAAGPLEELLVRHHQRLFDQIAAEARQSENLRTALKEVWLEEKDAVYPKWRALMSELGLV